MSAPALPKPTLSLELMQLFRPGLLLLQLGLLLPKPTNLLLKLALLF
jgi:hypothetical protein